MVRTLDRSIFIEDSNYPHNLRKFQFHIEYFIEVKPNKNRKFENFKKAYLFELISYDSKIHVIGNSLSELINKMAKFYPDEAILASLEDDMRYLLSIDYIEEI